MRKKKIERRRSLPELVSRYKREPELCDIYVEGAKDKSFIEWFLDANGLKDRISIYEISTVDVPSEKIKNLGLNLGSNRSRIITLANYLEQELEDLLATLKVMFVADRDFDFLVGEENKWKLKMLLFTDYSGLEMYWFNAEVINKFIHSIGYNGSTRSDRILNVFSPVLLELFLIRAANQLLGLEIKALKDFGDCCNLNGDSIYFDTNLYISKYLDKGAKRLEEKNFREKIDELRNYADKNIFETRFKMHGHDFSKILSWYVKKYLAKNKRNLDNPETIETILSACGKDLTMLESETLFKTLLSRLSPRSE